MKTFARTQPTTGACINITASRLTPANVCNLDAESLSALLPDLTVRQLNAACTDVVINDADKLPVHCVEVESFTNKDTERFIANRALKASNMGQKIIEYFETCAELPRICKHLYQPDSKFSHITYYFVFNTKEEKVIWCLAH